MGPFALFPGFMARVRATACKEGIPEVPAFHPGLRLFYYTVISESGAAISVLDRTTCSGPAELK